MSKIPPKKSYLFAAVLLIAALLFARLFSVDSSNTEQYADEEGSPGTDPGWLEQFHAMKANSDGVIPKGLYSKWYSDEVKAKRSDETNLKGVLELGPSNVGGRTRAMIIDDANHRRFLAAGISGGLWESTFKGVGWTAHNDQSPNLNISAMIQSPFDADLIYYGTGESAGSGNSSGAPGEGIFKSSDGGKTFTQLESTLTAAFEYIWDIKHSLVDEKTFFVGTRSSGLYRTTDAGQTFEQVYKTSAGIHDVECFPDGKVMIGVSGAGIFESSSGDQGTFKRIAKGAPTSGIRRVQIEYCKKYPKVVYAQFENSSGNNLQGFYKSSDQGRTWKEMDNPASAGVRYNFPWYCLALGIHPSDSNKVISAGVSIGFSTNGGESWRQARSSHADYHIIVPDKDDEDVMYICNDGGIYEYSWSNMFVFKDLNEGYNVTQYYAGSYFPTGMKVIGGTQDNGTHFNHDETDFFQRILGGDGAYTHINQQSPAIGYASTQRGMIRRSGNMTDLEPSFTLVLGELDANRDGTIDDGAWFINPYEINPLNGDQLFYVTRGRVWMSLDGAGSWQKMSDVFTDPYGIGLSNSKNPVVYVGGRALNIQRFDNPTEDNTRESLVLKRTAPKEIWEDFISGVTVHPWYDDVVYIGLSNYEEESRIWKILDADTDSSKWIDISGDLPEILPVNSIVVDPKNPDSVIYAATDFGLYSTTNGGKNWLKEQAIPNVAIHYIKLRSSDRRLYIYTHGRGIWKAEIPFEAIQPSSTPERIIGKAELYPNPAQDFIKLEAEASGGFYSILGMNGQIVKQGKVSDDATLAINELNPGTYVLRLEKGRGVKTARFVKQ